MTMQATETAPIRKRVVVPLPVEKAFRLFTNGAGGWWPLDTHSIGGEKVEAVVFDEHEGGRVYERHSDGTEHDWGDIIAWGPPHRFALEWRVSPRAAGSEVEVRFSPEDEGTRVDLEHRGWDKCGPAERASYDGGWEHVLGKFAVASA